MKFVSIRLKENWATYAHAIYIKCQPYFECDPVRSLVIKIKGKKKKGKTNLNKWSFYSSLKADSGTGRFNGIPIHVYASWILNDLWSGLNFMQSFYF